MITKDYFENEVEKIVKNSKMSYLEAVGKFCDNENIEGEDISRLVKKSYIYDLLEKEGITLNLVKK